MKFAYEFPELTVFSCGEFAAGITTLPEGDSGQQTDFPNDGD